MLKEFEVLLGGFSSNLSKAGTIITLRYCKDCYTTGDRNERRCAKILSTRGVEKKKSGA